MKGFSFLVGILILLGFMIGCYVTLSGGGGAGLYLGVLISVAGVSPSVGTTTSLYVALPALVIDSISYYKTGNMHFKIGNKMLLSAVPMTIIGSIISKFIANGVYRWIIFLIFVVLGLKVLWGAFSKKKPQTSQKSNNIKAYTYGIISGLMVGVAGLSGGIPLVVGMLMMGLTLPEAAATSSYALIVNSLVGILLRTTGGTVAWGPGISMMIGGIIGCAIMPQIVSKFNPKKVTKVVQPIIGFLILGMGFTILF